MSKPILNKHLDKNGDAHSVASSDKNGFISKEDKEKLDNLADVATSGDFNDLRVDNMESVYRSGKDLNDVFTVLEWKRSDNTLSKKSVLSGGTSPNYTTRTVTLYEQDGVTVKAQFIYTLTYDNGDFISEVLT